MLENTTLAVGLILLVGICGGKIASYIGLPSVTGYLLAGAAVGPSALDLFSNEVLENIEPINSLALGIIAVTIGGELTWERLKFIKDQIPPIFLCETVLTFILVALVSYFLSGSLPLSVVLAVLSLATAPGAIISIIREYRARGEFPQILLSLVALDNLLCIVGFGFATAALRIGFYRTIEPADGMLRAIFGELGVAAAVGVGFGMAVVLVSDIRMSDEKLLVINLGALLVAVGLGQLLHLPSLFIAMLMGIVISNFSPHNRRIFRLFGQVEFPILIAFLTLAGIKLDLSVLGDVGFLAAGYIIARFLGKILGARIGALFSRKMSAGYRKNVGLALTPQAGVAIGLAVLVGEKIPMDGSEVITLILSAVVFFEIVGPILVKRAMKNCGCIDG